MCMSNNGDNGESAIKHVLEATDDEICWINEPTWNDSLWVENNCTIELDESGHFFSEEWCSVGYQSEVFGYRSTTRWSSDSDNEDQERQVEGEECQCHREISRDRDWDSNDCLELDMKLEDSKKKRMLKSEVIYDNYTDDVKLSLVSCGTKTADKSLRGRLGSAKISSIPVAAPRSCRTNRSCCEHKYVFREKHDYLRRSSPSSSRTPSSKSSSAASLTSAGFARESRSLSPRLVHRAVEAHIEDMSKSPIYRDCCNKGNALQPEKSTSARRIAVSDRRLSLSPAGRARNGAADRNSSTNISPVHKLVLQRHRKSVSPHLAVPQRNVGTLSSPPTISERYNRSQDLKKPTPETQHHRSSGCRKDCCSISYQTRPKFDYLRAGSGAKRSPRRHSAAETKPPAADKIPVNRRSANKSARNINDNSNNNNIHLSQTSYSSYTTSSSPLHCPVVDEPDQTRNPGERLRCDEMLLEFPSLYYKLDCSGEAADVDLENRKSKAGVVYRILDNGDVICESHPEDNLSNVNVAKEIPSGSESEPDGRADSSPPSPAPAATTETLSDNDLSLTNPNRALSLLNEVLPDDSQTETSLSTTNTEEPEVLLTSTSQAEQILAELDSIGGDESTVAVSLFDLITGMSPPEELQDLPESQRPPSDAVDGNNTNPQERPSASPEVCESDGSSHPDVCDSPLEDFLSSGVEELPSTDEDEDEEAKDALFRPISGSPEYDSDTRTRDDITEVHQVSAFRPIIRDPVISSVATEPALATEFMPLEAASEHLITPLVRPRVHRDLVNGHYEASINEQFELSGVGLRRFLDGALEAAIVTDILPVQRSADEELIHPSRRGRVEQPNVRAEPTLEEVESDNRLSGYSDTEDLNEAVLEQVQTLNTAQPEVAERSQVPTLETPTVSHVETSQAPDQPDSGVPVGDADSGSAVNIVLSPPDSDAFDGDESSEGEDEQQTRKVVPWPNPPLDMPATMEEFTRESSVETMRPTGAELIRESSSGDPPAKVSPNKRRRKRRPRTLTGSPKLHDDDTPMQPKSPEEPSPYVNNMPAAKSHDLLSSNQLTDEEPIDQSPNEELSDVISSDNDDLLNSAGLSEGSNWDYYQAHSSPVFHTKDPLYSTGTEAEFDIDLEPKLDDSALQWDDELDDHNDTLTHVPIAMGAVAAGANAASDSEDSDIEDLHYVIQQSSTQLVQADSALRKPRKDVVQSGIYLDPRKYVEWHATCQTNVKCLQVIQEHLESEQGLANVTDDDIQQVLDLIKKWQSLEKISLERKDQSSALCKIYRDILMGKKLVKLCEEELSTPAFNDVAELENHFRSLQTFRVNLQSQSHKIQQISDAVLVFESENKKVKMAGFKELIAELSSSIKPSILSVGKKTTELQYAVVQWHKWNADCKELETSLVKTSYDIESVELGLCEQRLVELETSFSEFSSVCTDTAHSYTEEKLASLRTRLNHLMADKAGTEAVEEVESYPLDDSLEEEISTAGLPNSNDLESGIGDEGSNSEIFYENDNATLVSESSPAPSLTLDISPATGKSDSFKSSMESGFATMDTGRSWQDDLVGKQEQGSPKDVRLLQIGNRDPEQSADNPDLTPAVDITSPSHDTAELRGTPTMTPLAVDVNNDNDMGNSDHQTPPTVEDLAPTLPITDQQKIHVAKQSKRNKKNKRKGRNKNQNTSQSEPVAHNSSSNQTGSSSISHDQFTSTEVPSLENVELQTENTRLFADSFTNTDYNPDTQSQTDQIPSIDQSTCSDSQNVVSQGVLTDDAETSSATNQTDPLFVDSIGNQAGPSFTDRTQHGFSRATNTPANSHSCQTASLQTLQPDNTQPRDNSSTQTDQQTPFLEEILPADEEYKAPPVDEKALPPVAVDEFNAEPVVELPPVVDEQVVAEEVLRQRKVQDVNVQLSQPKARRAEDGAKAKPVSRQLFTRRNLKYLAAIAGSVLFLFALVFLLQPKCCENTRYHKGIFGLRRQYTDLPPH